jgi:hypothetical protein
MKVKELIEELQKKDQELEVYRDDSEFGPEIISNVGFSVIKRKNTVVLS